MATLPALRHRGLAALALALGACGEGEPASPRALGTGIEVSNQTFGDPIEHDGFTVTVDAAARALDVNGSVVFTDLDPGDHTVELAGIEPDCEVLGVNPRTVHTTGGTASSLFLVRCSVAGTGRIIVQTTTYGDDPDGYRVEMDGGRFLDLGEKDEDVFSAVPVGPATLTLTGEGAGCEVVGPNPRTIQVREHEEHLSIFKIHCPV